MDIIELFDCIICFPDGGQTGCLCRHDIDTDTEIGTQGCHTRPYKLHYFILHITIPEYGPDNRQCHILRTYTLHRLTGQIHTNHTGHIDIVSLG